MKRVAPGLVLMLLLNALYAQRILEIPMARASVGSTDIFVSPSGYGVLVQEFHTAANVLTFFERDKGVLQEYKAEQYNPVAGYSENHDTLAAYSIKSLNSKLTAVCFLKRSGGAITTDVSFTDQKNAIKILGTFSRGQKFYVLIANNRDLSISFCEVVGVTVKTITKCKLGKMVFDELKGRDFAFLSAEDEPELSLLHIDDKAYWQGDSIVFNYREKQVGATNYALIQCVLNLKTGKFWGQDIFTFNENKASYNHFLLGDRNWIIMSKKDLLKISVQSGKRTEKEWVMTPQTGIPMKRSLLMYSDGDTIEMRWKEPVRTEKTIESILASDIIAAVNLPQGVGLIVGYQTYEIKTSYHLRPDGTTVPVNSKPILSRQRFFFTCIRSDYETVECPVFLTHQLPAFIRRGSADFVVTKEKVQRSGPFTTPSDFLSLKEPSEGYGDFWIRMSENKAYLLYVVKGEQKICVEQF